MLQTSMLLQRSNKRKCFSNIFRVGLNNRQSFKMVSQGFIQRVFNNSSVLSRVEPWSQSYYLFLSYPGYANNDQERFFSKHYDVIMTFDLAYKLSSLHFNFLDIFDFFFIPNKYIISKNIRLTLTFDP